MTFTGIVKALGTAVWDSKKFILTVKTNYPGFWKKASLGDSIAVNGVCLTLLEETDTDEAQFFVMEETRILSTIGQKEMFVVNLEHALCRGESIGGHYVTGHVHNIGTITRIDKRVDESSCITIRVGDTTKTVLKDSIALDGVSLTITNVNKDASEITVCIIPHTRLHTIFQYREEGDLINIEYNMKSDFIDVEEVIEEVGDYDDELFMRKAIKVGKKGRFTSSPNPWVGCVIVKNGKVIGKGYHHAKGLPHAEINAIQKAISNNREDELKGSTLYVTLEPCSHQGSTPPCVDSLIKVGIKKVVVGVTDPDGKVKGSGIGILRAAGIEVVVGVCERKVRKSLSSYLFQRTFGRPKVILKMGMSIDGCVSCHDGTSQWITGADSRKHAHKYYRGTSQAIIVGAGTVRTDNPSLTVRDDNINQKATFKQPLRVVLDSKNSLKGGDYKVFTDGGETLLWGESLAELMVELSDRGFLQVMIEGGAGVASSALSLGIVDEIVVYQGPILLGSSANPWVTNELTKTISDAKIWKLKKVRKLNNDVMMLYAK